MNNKKEYEICIIGLGPAGIGAALTIKDFGISSEVICIDAGNAPEMRPCSLMENKKCNKDNPCNIISGFGGCSLISGGKISDYPAGSVFAEITGSKELAQKEFSGALKILREYITIKKPEITSADIENANAYFNKMGFEYKYYDAYSYDGLELKQAYGTILSQLRICGMEVLLNTKVIEINKIDDIFEISINQKNVTATFKAKKVILGVGRFGESFLKDLNKKLKLNGKINKLDVGVRLEFPTEILKDFFCYHNDLKLKFNKARTYCVSKDGKIALYFNNNTYFTEGYSSPENKTSLTNMAILYRLEKSIENDTIFKEIQDNFHSMSNGYPIAQKLVDYLNNDRTHSKRITNSSISLFVNGNINDCFPKILSQNINKSVEYFVSKVFSPSDWDKVNVFAPEADYMSIAFPIKHDFSVTQGLYVIGSGTGNFRGILQAFCSGLICSRSIIGGYYE